MKKLVFAILTFLAGCATTEAVQRPDTASDLLCVPRCQAYADTHGYVLALVGVDGNNCVCRMQSPHDPDTFDVPVKRK